MQVLEGGHDVPAVKCVAPYPRATENLRRALAEVLNVRVYDNSDLADPYRLVVTREGGGPISPRGPVPEWICALVAGS